MSEKSTSAPQSVSRANNRGEFPKHPPASFVSSLVAGLAFAGIGVTLISALASQHWIADLFAQFKLHCAGGLLIALICLALLKRWKLFVLCLIALIVSAIPIWPYLAGTASQIVGGVEDKTETVGQTSSDATLRILSLNVLTNNRQYQSVIDFLNREQADFVVLMEVDAAWKKMLEPLDDTYEFTRFETREDNFGIAFLSKHAWSSIEVFDSQTLKLPSVDVTFTGPLKVAVPSAGNPIATLELVLSKPLRIIGTHPIPPLSERNTAARNEQLTNVAGRFDANTYNLMAGDFNLTPWSPAFADVLSTGNLVDASLRFGVVPTWYVFPTWIGGLKIDHVLLGPDVAATNHRIGLDVGSDHRAVIVDFQLK